MGTFLSGNTSTSTSKTGEPTNSSTPPLRATTPPACRFLLDSSTSATLTLPSGRKLGYATYGALTGSRAVLYQHGFPGSRIEAATWDELGKKFGVRVIAADRPGHGLSDPRPDGWTLKDHVADVETLAERLGVEEYYVLGCSGGGPSALACARYLPRARLRRVSAVVGLGPPSIGMRGADLLHWAAFPYGFRYFGYPWILKLGMGRGPECQFHLSDEERLRLLQRDIAAAEKKGTANLNDKSFTGDVDLLRLHLASMREAFRQGWSGPTRDGVVSSTDFGFRLDEIAEDLQVQLWYGKQDVFVPAFHGEGVARMLGHRAKLRVEDETHSGLQAKYKEEIFRSLLEGS